MADWLERTVVYVAVVTAVFLALWPTSHSGKRLLRTWGIPDPRPDQVDEAIRYLRRRRLLAVGLFVVSGLVAGAVLRSDAPGVGICVPLLVAMLIAELVATVRPASGVRVALLTRREWRDLVPRWAIPTMAVLVVLTTGLAVSGLVIEPPAGRYANIGMTSWTALGYVVACVTLVGLLVHLAVRRPSVADEEVDATLRARTARVAIGLGFGWLGASAQLAGQRYSVVNIAEPEHPPADWFGDIAQAAGVIAFAVSIVCWLWVAVPSRRSLARKG
ncbi:hypothetical protein [Actinophytocola sp.]|uniref:hypothetical protein n=1 Tax=Actinophytocola sp. TaxID=1872138 RepID=UPI002ECFCD6C